MKDTTTVHLDREIASLQEKIDELERLRTMHGKKRESIEKVRSKLQDILAEHGLSEGELFTIISDQIVGWVTASAPGANRSAPRYWLDLQQHFAKHAPRAARAPAAGKKAKGKSTDADEPAPLPAGIYENPHTGERIEKIKRPTRQLMDWCTEHGIETVRGWIKTGSPKSR